MATSTNVSVDGQSFIIKCEYFDNERAKNLPDRTWSALYKHWIAPISKTNAQYINSVYKATEIDEFALRTIKIATSFIPKEKPFPQYFGFKNKPMDHQLVALRRAYPLREFALFMDMGTGKTFTAISLAAAHFVEDDIDALLVVCPTSVKPVWLDELELHCGIEYTAWVHEAGKDRQTETFIYNAQADKLKVLIVGVESLSQGRAYNHIDAFCKMHKTMMVIDESSTIKTPPKSKGGKIVPSRTSRCWDAGELCEYRVIMTGTPITQGIQDLFAQFRFLNWEIIGNKNYYSFKARYTISGGFQGKKIIGYQNVDELIDRVKPWVYNIKITDVMNMPEQVYESKFCTPNPIQTRLLKDLGDPYNMSTEMDGDVLECETVLERMIRFQQIVGGHFPFALEDDKGYDIKVIPGKNPKMEELKTIIEQIDDKRKVIIWARFFPEQKMIADTLVQMGHHPVWYRGGLTTDERRAAVKQFREDPTCRFFVSGGAGYRGLTLVEADLAIYYSNTFSYDDREQSERRPWRKGQTYPVTYIDLTMNHKIDKQILLALKRKEDLAKFVDKQLREQT